MEKGYVVKKYGHSLHIILSKKDFQPGEMVVVMVPSLLDERIKKLCKGIVQEEIYKLKNGY